MITDISPQPLTHILERLRVLDQQEIDAVRGPGKWQPRPIAQELCRVGVNLGGWLFWDGGPVAALGAFAMTPTCAGCWALGTDQWPSVFPEMTKHIRRVMIPQLLAKGFHRAECRALASRSDTKRWLRSFGWRAEAVLSGFGVRREDFILFAWVADEQTDHPRQSERPSSLSLC